MPTRLPASETDATGSNGIISLLLRRLFLFGFLMGMVILPTTSASGAIVITGGSWSTDRDRLFVRGEGAPPNSTVNIKYGSKTDNGDVIGTTLADSGGAWVFRVSGPEPVPCDVTAQAGGIRDDKRVWRAPDNCSNSAGILNDAPRARANGPYSGSAGVAVKFSKAGSYDPDGNIVAFKWDFGDGRTSNGPNPGHKYVARGTYRVTLTVTDNQGTTATDSTTATITGDAVACASPVNAHCRITKYTGPEVCVECHESEARDMHGSVHYQQGGSFPNVTNIPARFAAAGERPAQAAGELVANGINTYCGTHENSPRFTCAGCHVGNGRFPMAQSEFELMDPASNETHRQLANIDCLMCHQELYKRFPDWTRNGEGFSNLTLLNLKEDANGDLLIEPGAELIRTGFAGIPDIDPITQDFQFLPAGSDTLPATVPMPPMALTTLEAAQTVHTTTRKSCLNCHAGAAGADGAKRGDLSKENENPRIAIDMHMSRAGADLSCADCHNETLPDGTTHRVRGRGVDLRPNDVENRFSCDNSGCHSARPHGDFSNRSGSSKDKHAMKVACQTCHIPSYAKAAVGTETARDWQDPHPSAAACNGRGGWLPREDKAGLKGASLVPDYAWFNGTSKIYYLGQSLRNVPTIPLARSVAARFVGDFNAGDPAYVIGMPNGNVNSTGIRTKIYPMKEHWGKLARDDANNTLVGHSTFEFFRTGSFCRAVAVGLGLEEVNAKSSSFCSGLPGSTEMPPGTTAVPVHTYQSINHGVEVADNALQCNDCHGVNARMNLQADLGYKLKGPRSKVCTQCHEDEGSMNFTQVHNQHVVREARDCSVCHTFSRPERGLSKRLGD